MTLLLNNQPLIWVNDRSVNRLVNDGSIDKLVGLSANNRPVEGGSVECELIDGGWFDELVDGLVDESSGNGESDDHLVDDRPTDQLTADNIWLPGTQRWVYFPSFMLEKYYDTFSGCQCHSFVNMNKLLATIQLLLAFQ